MQFDFSFLLETAGRLLVSLAVTDAVSVTDNLASAILMFITFPGIASTDVSQDVVLAVQSFFASLLSIPLTHVSVIWIANTASSTATVIQIALIAPTGTTRTALRNSIASSVLTADGRALNDAVLSVLESGTGLVLSSSSVTVQVPNPAATPSAETATSSGAEGGLAVAPWVVAVILVAGGIGIASAILIGAHLRQPLKFKLPSLPQLALRQPTARYRGPPDALERQPLSPSTLGV